MKKYYISNRLDKELFLEKFLGSFITLISGSDCESHGEYLYSTYDNFAILKQKNGHTVHVNHIYITEVILYDEG